jgi:uncharacterized repeat protein (TIGR03803 family)
MTFEGGVHGGVHGGGIVFKVTPEGVETVLHSFTGPPADGAIPGANATLIQGSDGNLYGTTSDGGAVNNAPTDDGWGTVFKITPEGVETIFHSFSGGQSDGELPLGPG